MSGFLSISIKALFLSLVDPILDGIKIAKFLYDNLNACKCNKEFNLDSKNKIDWLTFNDNEKSVVEDVLKLKNHPLVPNSIPIYGYIYDCKTGNLKEVFEATKAVTKFNSNT